MEFNSVCRPVQERTIFKQRVFLAELEGRNSPSEQLVTAPGGGSISKDTGIISSSLKLNTAPKREKGAVTAFVIRLTKALDRKSVV